MKSTTSTGVYTIPNFATVLGEAVLKNLSYSSTMIRCLPSASSIPLTVCARSHKTSAAFHVLPRFSPRRPTNRASLHRFRNGITVRKFVVFEQCLEHGARNDMLREHFDDILFRKVGIDIAAQSLHQLFESTPMLAVIGYQCLDALDVLFGDPCDIFRPLLPIPFRSDFRHHLGIEDVLQLSESHCQLTGHCLRGTFVLEVPSPAL